MPISGFGRNVILFGVDVSSSVYVDNKIFFDSWQKANTRIRQYHINCRSIL